MPFIYKANKAPPHAQVGDIEDLILEYVPDFKAAYRKFTIMMRALSKSTPISKDGKAAIAHLTSSPRAQRIYGVYRSDLEDVYKELGEEAGQLGLKAAGIQDKMRFVIKAKGDEYKRRIGVPINPYSKKWIAEQSSKHIVQIKDGIRVAVRAMVAEGYKQNLHPDVLRTKIGQTVGLNDRLAGAVSKRYDATVRANLRAGASIESAHDTAKAVADDYADKLMDYRGEMIARTEGKFAQEAGRKDAWRVADDEGLMPDSARQQWACIFDSRTAPECKAMDGQTVGLDEDFDSEDYGRVPHPPLFPNCRCTVVLVFE